jgi:hypothetical protein
MGGTLVLRVFLVTWPCGGGDAVEGPCAAVLSAGVSATAYSCQDSYRTRYAALARNAERAPPTRRPGDGCPRFSSGRVAANSNSGATWAPRRRRTVVIDAGAAPPVQCATTAGAAGEGRLGIGGR